ncbi:hypothetical protein MMC25_005870 [Agyrium rufum]|nr:hypothetical protein [Agyrium rufum]
MCWSSIISSSSCIHSFTLNCVIVFLGLEVSSANAFTDHRDILNQAFTSLSEHFKREGDDIGGRIKVHPDNNPAHLPWAIGSIVGAWGFLTLFFALLILTVGRRLRRRAQTSGSTLDMEMVKPRHGYPEVIGDGGLRSPVRSAQHPFDITPVSPAGKEVKWPSSAGLTRHYTWGSLKKAHSKHQSVTSNSTFDENVIEEDRARAQLEMERLYAAVMEDDERKSSPPTVASYPTSPLAQNPPELQHLRYPQQNPYYQPETHSQQNGLHYSPPPVPEGPTYLSRLDTTSPGRSKKHARPSPISISGASMHSLASSQGSFGRNRSIRHLAISPPMGSPDMDADHARMYSEAEPLSPRFYTPGPPPTPPTAIRSKAKNDDDRYHERYSRAPKSPSVMSSHTPPLSPTIPASPRSVRSTTRHAHFQFPPRQQTRDQTVAEGQERPQEDNDDAADREAYTQAMNPHWTPQPQPQTPRSPQNFSIPSRIQSPRLQDPPPPRRTGSTASNQTTTTNASAATGMTGRSKPKPTPLSLRTGTSNTPAISLSNHANSSQNSLPLRSAPLTRNYTNPLALHSANRFGAPTSSTTSILPLRALKQHLMPSSPTAATSSNNNNNRPISTIQSTILERPSKNNNRLDMLRTPMTGVPQTPYSPYMPYTPLTPLTPSRLVGRAERKRREREEGRRVLSAEDAVPEEEELWGDGW